MPVWWGKNQWNNIGKWWWIECHWKIGIRIQAKLTIRQCPSELKCRSNSAVGAYNDDRVDAVIECDQLSSFVELVNPANTDFYIIVASYYPNVGDIDLTIAQYISDSELLSTTANFFFNYWNCWFWSCSPNYSYPSIYCYILFYHSIIK